MEKTIEQDFIGCIPSIPNVALEFIALSKEHNPKKRSFANLLLSEPSLSALIFAYINSVFNSQNSNYISINKGVSLMGLQKFKNIVLVFSLYPVFFKANSIELFKHSLLTGYCSKTIASEFKLINPNDAFLLGFLHDIGKISLKNKFHGEYSAFCEFENSNDPITLENENLKFGYSHFDISEYICKIWGLPLVVADSIKHHHFPLNAMLPQAASIVYLADLLAHKSTKNTNDGQKVLQYLRLSKSDITTLTTDCERKIEPFLKILNL